MGNVWEFSCGRVHVGIPQHVDTILSWNELNWKEGGRNLGFFYAQPAMMVISRQELNWTERCTPSQKLALFCTWSRDRQVGAGLALTALTVVSSFLCNKDIALAIPSYRIFEGVMFPSCRIFEGVMIPSCRTFEGVMQLTDCQGLTSPCLLKMGTLNSFHCCVKLAFRSCLVLHRCSVDVELWESLSLSI